MSKIAEAFDGKTYDDHRDKAALTAQLDAVRSFMLNSREHYTLDEIATAAGLRLGHTVSTASVSARLRDLRKAKFGGYDIQRRARKGFKRLFEYHLEFPQTKPAPSLGTALAAGVIVCGLFLGLMMGPALGHDLWISKGALKNPAGEWCCGVADCGVVDADAVHAGVGGYSVAGRVTYGEGITGNPADGPTHRDDLNETIPYSQTLPSPDGAYWRCKRPDGSPRCFFAPPPGT